MSESIQVSSKLTFVESFFLSGTAAVVSKTAAAPLERIKMLLQNQDENIRKGRLKEPYKGVFDCAKRVYTEEGLLAFWRSNGTNCLRYFPTQALNFAFRDKIRLLIPSHPDDPFANKLAKNVTSGGLAGGLSSVFVYHLDYARTRLANDLKGSDGERKFKGLREVYRMTLATDGVAGLYRGFCASLVGIMVYRGAYFGLYDTLKPIVLPKDAGLFESFLLGYGVTVTAGLAAYPIDTVRRRMMEVSGESKEMQYKGSLDAFQKIAKTEGMGSFFKGAGANILRGVAGAGVLAGFDKLQHLYLKFKEEKE